MKSQNGLKKTSTALGLLGALIVAPLYAVKVWLKTDYTDFDVYYKAASRMAAGNWAEVYSLSDGASPFRYAPVTLPLLRPFAELSHDGAKMLWYALQYFWFSAGFYFLYLTLQRILRHSPSGPTSTGKPTSGSDALWMTSLAFLFVLRFCLDCFTIGQVSSLLFMCFCASLYAWVSWKSSGAGTALLVPALVKIGPGFLYPLFLHSRPKARLQAVTAPLLTSIIAVSLSALWIGSLSRNQFLWSHWSLMVRADSAYYDASHYGSQSVKSALLRMVNSHWISLQTCHELYIFAAIVLCGSVLLFWMGRTPKRPMGRAATFALGLFPYLWIMPETFKYSLTVLAIPASLLFADLLTQPYSHTQAQSNRKTSIFALAVGILCLSLAGKDILGDTLFFGFQKASLPLIATFLLGWATFKLAWKESRDTAFTRELKNILASNQTAPWHRDEIQPKFKVSVLVPLPMQASVSLNGDAVIDFLTETAESLAKQTDGSFEILVQPYGDLISEFNPLWIALKEKQTEIPQLQLLHLRLPESHFPTRNAALRDSFLQSSGSVVFTANLVQPCGPEFYQEALKLLCSGASLVRGNRRHQATRFKIPVRLLPIVYQRHRLGLRFNRLIRLLLPLKATDTHSGFLGMTREFARVAFALQSSYGFLFDLEISLIAQAYHVTEKDLTLTVILAEEKSQRRMFLETLSILMGLPRLVLRVRSQYYLPIKLDQNFTADDWGLTPEVNQGILDLARAGIVKRVSVMADAAYITTHLQELQELPRVELGLHFDLTYGKSRPRDILLRWIRPGRNVEELKSQVRQEFRRQMEKLKKMGIEVRYLDGHHHIHLVPGIMDALSSEIRHENIRLVRCPFDPSLWLTPRFGLNILSIFASRRIKALGFDSLPCFYPQNGHFRDPGLLRTSLAKHHGYEIIVHPARRNDLTELNIADPYRDGRVTEYRALKMLAHTRGLAPEGAHD